MNDINNNLVKLQSQVMQINDMFKKQTSQNTAEYISYLNISIVRIIILFLFFTALLYTVKPEFCCEEVVNNDTFFKEKIIQMNYVYFVSLLLTGTIFYFTNQIHF